MEYLERGGFLWVDDFWGEAEWRNLERNTLAAAPDWEWRDLAEDHPILDTVYPLKKCPQVPAIQFYGFRGPSHDPHWIHRQPNGGEADLRAVHLRGLFDSKNRLLAVATHNTEIGDGFERETESSEFFDRFSVNAYAMAINILVYAFTH